MNYSNFSHIHKTRLMDRGEIKFLFGVIMGTLCVITTFGNILVIYKYRKASMVGNLFIISLAFADLIVGSFVMPLATIYAITDVWTMTLPVCLIWLSADYTASTASILNLLTLSLDRYWSITSPLAYLGKRTKSRALIMISFAWSISLLWLVPITGWPYFFNRGHRTVSKDKCNTEYDKNILFKMATAIINFYLPLIAMIAINTKIYLVIHKRYRNPIMRYSSMITQDSTIKSSKQKSFSICSSNDDEKLSSNGTIKRIPTFKYNLCPTINDSNNYNVTLSNRIKKMSKSNENFESNETFHSKKAYSDLRCNKLNSDIRRTKKACSLIADLQQIRLIPENTLKIKRLFYSNDKFVPSTNENNQEIDAAMSSISYKSYDDQEKIEKNLKQITKSIINKNSRNRVNRKGFMNKQEKAFKQLSSIVIGFTVCFTPYFIVFLIVAICENCVSDEIFTVTVWLGYFNSTMNPFLYALFNNRIKKSEMKKLKNMNDLNTRKSSSRVISSRKSIW